MTKRARLAWVVALVDIASVSTNLAGTVQTAIRPTNVSIWLRARRP